MSIHRFKSLAGMPFVLDATGKAAFIVLKDGDKSHRFTFGGLANSPESGYHITTSEGFTIRISEVTAKAMAEIKPPANPSAKSAPQPSQASSVMTIKAGFTTIIFDGITVTLSRPSIWAVNRGDKTILVSQISSIQLKEKGMTGGYIQFIFPGSRDMNGNGSFHDRLNDENTVIFNNGRAAEFRALRDAIMARVIELKSPQSSPMPKTSDADEIERLAALRDRGHARWFHKKAGGLGYQPC